MNSSTAFLSVISMVTLRFKGSDDHNFVGIYGKSPIDLARVLCEQQWDRHALCAASQLQENFQLEEEKTISNVNLPR